jgi:hypothetical protein
MSPDLLVLLTLLVALVALDVAAVRFGADSRSSRTMDPAQPARRDI